MKSVLLMFSLTLLLISLGTVSAIELDDTNSSSVYIDENSQINEIKEKTIENNEDTISVSDENEILSISDDSEDVLSADVGLDVVNPKTSYETTDSITVKMGTYTMASESDAVTVYLNGNSIATTSYGQITGSGYAVPLTSAKTGSNSIYCSFTAASIWPMTSDTVTFTVSESGPVTPVENSSASISIYDINYPSQSVIITTGDYVADIAYTISRSGDGFTDESLEVYVNGNSIGSTTPNSYNRLGSLTINEDNTWIVKIVYTATVNNQLVTATSNELTFITNGTSGGNSSSNGTDGSNSSANDTDDGNSSTNGTDGDEQEPSGDVKLIIKDVNYPDNATITLNDVYNVAIKYYVVVPSSSLITNDLIFICNGNGFLTITGPNNKTYTTLNGLLLLNESGDYLITAKYMYWDMMAGLSGEIESNSITYHVILSNETATAKTLSISVNDVDYPNEVTAIVRSNVDGVYIVKIGDVTKEVTVNGGIGSVNFSLTADHYTATVSSKNDSSLSNSTSFNVNQKDKVDPSISVSSNVNGNKVTLQITLPNDVNGKVVVSIDNKKSDVNIVNGITSYIKTGLSNGEHSYTVSFAGNDKYNAASSQGSFTVDVPVQDTKIDPTMSSSVKVNGAEAIISVILSDDITGNVVLKVGSNYYNVPISNGEGSYTLNNLAKGSYSYTLSYGGNDRYNSKEVSGSFVIDTQEQNPSKFSIEANGLTRAENSPYDFKATFYDADGNLLVDAEVNFIINGNDYMVKTDEYGVAKLVKVLSVGSYSIEIKNLVTDESLIRNVTIVNRITGNKDINVDYSYSANYKIRLFADNGKPVGYGEKVVITLNKVKYNVVTDNDGYASFKIRGLLPKTYTVTSEYRGVKVSNKVVVKQILKAKNVKFKKSKKVKKYKVTLKTSKGKAIKGKKITLKVKGKTLKAKTNKKGVATFKIKHLKKAGKFKATIKYLKTSIVKTIKIKK